MVRLDVLAPLLAVAGVAQAVAGNTPQIVPGAYIVEYERPQDTRAFLRKIHGEAKLRKELNFKLFKGASIQFTDTESSEEMAAKVAEMGIVKNMWPVKRYPSPQHTVHSTGSAVQAAIEKRQVGVRDKDTFTPHLMTQVNKFRDAGETGKGIKIAVIDTGVS